MQAQDFARFVASQQTQDVMGDVDPDWADVRETWLKDLDRLYLQIGAFLDEFVAAGSIRFSFAEITLVEENLGSYRAKTMEIGIGRQHVLLEPVGTLLIGTRGRVDVVGSAGRAQLMLGNQKAQNAADLISVKLGMKRLGPSLKLPAERSAEWVWKIVSRDLRTVFVELEKESFFFLLMEIAGG